MKKQYSYAWLMLTAYIDEKPIRACIDQSLESSDFTSIQQRVKEVKVCNKPSAHCAVESPENSLPLLPFIEAEHIDRRHAAIRYNVKHYIELVDWTGRQYRDDKPGSIRFSEPAALKKLGVSGEQWMLLVRVIQSSQLTAIHGGEITLRELRRAGG